MNCPFFLKSVVPQNVRWIACQDSGSNFLLITGVSDDFVLDLDVRI